MGICYLFTIIQCGISTKYYVISALMKISIQIFVFLFNDFYMNNNTEFDMRFSPKTILKLSK